MTCGNVMCDAYSKTVENHCTDTDVYESKDKIQGKKEHVFFTPEFCSLFITEKQYKKVA